MNVECNARVVVAALDLNCRSDLEDVWDHELDSDRKHVHSRDCTGHRSLLVSNEQLGELISEFRCVSSALSRALKRNKKFFSVCESCSRMSKSYPG